MSNNDVNRSDMMNHSASENTSHAGKVSTDHSIEHDTDVDRFVQGASSVLQQGPKVQLNPMSQLAASSTVVNLLLATGPFA